MKKSDKSLSKLQIEEWAMFRQGIVFGVIGMVILGVVGGLVGIVVLLMLIPLIKGLK